MHATMVAGGGWRVPGEDLSSGAGVALHRRLHPDRRGSRAYVPAPQRMRIREGGLPGVLVVEPSPLGDDRGFFVRTLDADALREVGVDSARFAQENQSRSGQHVLRGLHFRSGGGEAKLVRCARGRIFDVVVDLRPSSPAFGQWQSFVLDDVEHRQVYVPRGCAHGFQVLSTVADVCYHHDARYDPALEAAVAWDDGDLDVAWPHAPRNLSPRDRAAPQLAQLLPDLERWFGPTDGA